MSYHRVSTLFLIAVLFAAANPQAHGFFFNLNPRTQIVNGQLCCTANGNCPGTGVGGAVVSLNCPSLLGASTTIGQNTTDANGFFSITVSSSVPGFLLLNSLGLCLVNVQLPLPSAVCPVLSTTTGSLVSAIQPIGSFLGNIFSTVVIFTIRGFFLLSI